MNQLVEILLNTHEDIFAIFDQVAVFGSALRSDAPNDIDILLVYDNATPEQVNCAKNGLEEILAYEFPDYVLDFTTLSRSELQQTDFLAKVPHQKIKG